VKGLVGEGLREVEARTLLMGIPLTGASFALGFLLMTAPVSHGGEQAAELVSAESLVAGSDSIAHATIEGFVFAPDRVKVSTGTTVLWTNRDGVDHDVTLRNYSVASPLVGKGGEIAVAFYKPGEYRYYCHVHPFMQGMVVVE
jgi:plastocyanin